VVLCGEGDQTAAKDVAVIIEIKGQLECVRGRESKELSDKYRILVLLWRYFQGASEALL